MIFNAMTHEPMKQPKKDGNNFGKIIVYIVILLGISTLLYGGYYFWDDIFHNNSELISKNNKTYGELVSEKEDGKSFIAKLVTDNKALNQIVEEKIANLKLNIEEKKPYLIDYSSKIHYNNIVEIEYVFNNIEKSKLEQIEKTKFYFSLNHSSVIGIKDIFRDNFMNLVRRQHPELNIEDVDVNYFKFGSNNIILGEQGELVIEYDKYANIFKSGLGISSLYSGEVLMPKKYERDPSKKKIAFTFDDGPGNINHVKIREIFNKYEIPCTFYVLGDLVNRNSDMLMQSYLDGHEIGNHSKTHALFKRLSEKQIENEIYETNDIIFKLIGVDPYSFRPPYGNYNAKTIPDITNMPIAMWTIDTLDWKVKNDPNAKQKIVNSVLSGIRSNPNKEHVVLFHDLYPNTVEAVRELVPKLLAEGYQFVPFSEVSTRW